MLARLDAAGSYGQQLVVQALAPYRRLIGESSRRGDLRRGGRDGGRRLGRQVGRKKGGRDIAKEKGRGRKEVRREGGR